MSSVIDGAQLARSLPDEFKSFSICSEDISVSHTGSSPLIHRYCAQNKVNRF